MTITREMITALANAPDGLTTAELQGPWRREQPWLTRDEAMRRAGLAMRIHARKGNVKRDGTRYTGGHPANVWVITDQGREKYLHD